MGNTARTRWAEKHLAGRYEHDQIVEMAVSELNAQIDLGHEFPDSCLLVAGKYGITTGELTIAYDDQF